MTGRAQVTADAGVLGGLPEVSADQPARTLRDRAAEDTSADSALLRNPAWRRMSLFISPSGLSAVLVEDGHAVERRVVSPVASGAGRSVCFAGHAWALADEWQPDEVRVAVAGRLPDDPLVAHELGLLVGAVQQELRRRNVPVPVTEGLSEVTLHGPAEARR